MNQIQNTCHVIQGFLELIIGKKVPVKWGSTPAMGTDRTIELPLPKLGDAQEVALLTRLAVHEAGHMFDTDVAVMHRMDSASLLLFNAMEDARIERCQQNRFPGARLVLDRGLDGMLQSVAHACDPTNPESKARILLMALLTKSIMALAPNRAFTKWAPEFAKYAEAAIDQKDILAIDHAVDALKASANSCDVERIAIDLLGQLKQSSPSAPEIDNKEDPNPEKEESLASDSNQEVENQTGERGSSTTESEGEQSGIGPDAPTDVRPDNSAQDSPESAGQTDEARGSPERGAASEQSGLENDGSQPAESTADDGEGAKGQIDETSETSAAQTSGESKADKSCGSKLDTPASNDLPANREYDFGQQPSVDLGDLLRKTHKEQYGEPSGEAGPEPGECPQKVLKVLQESLNAGPEKVTADEIIIEAMAAVMSLDADQSIESAKDQTAVESENVVCEIETSRVPFVSPRLEGVQSRLVQVLRRELQETRRRPVATGRTGATIKTEKFWRLERLGDTKIFRIPQKRTGIDAAVAILLDTSGSMSKILAQAAEAAIAFSLALERVGRVKTALYEFPGVYKTVQEIQRFGEPARNCVGKVKELFAMGGTPMGEALMTVQQELLLQKQDKHLMVIITDGKPSNKESMRLAMQNAQYRGVTVVGIGVNVDISYYVPNSVCIRDVHDLPGALAELFKNQLPQLLAA